MLIELGLVPHVEIKWDVNEMHGLNLLEPALEVHVHELWETSFQLH